MIVLSIGSNLGDRLANLQEATDGFRPWLQTVSPVYETAPWGPVPQDDFLNAVLLLTDDAEPMDWLERAQAVENAAGRTREVHWGPRTLDVDIVAIDGVRLERPELVVPHPRAHERAFVLVPWLAADPRAELSGRPLAAWLAELAPEDVDGVRLVPDAVLR